MFMNRNRNRNPHCHQRDWFDLFNNGLALLDEDILARITLKGGMGDESCLPGSEQQHQVNSNDPKKFEVKLDVSHFTPSEIAVKVVENSLLVEGKHEEKQDKHGYVSRQFTRRYILDDDIDVEKMASSLSSDGKLTIHAPKKLQVGENELIIPITVGEKKQLEGARDVDMKE
jgi:crystallin, alpha B